MKFSCDRCGKKYATAEAPAPGRVYKLKCKACGHLIVVKTPAAAAPATTPSLAELASAGAASSVSLPAVPPPEVELEIEEPSAPAAEPPAAAPPAHTPVPTRESEPTAEISMMAPMEEPKPAGDGGYVDIFAESAPPPAAPISDDPFLRAAQGSRPEAGGAQDLLVDPFADMRDELAGSPDAAPRAPASPPVPEPVPAAFAPPPRRPDEEKKKGGLPLALIGIGFAAMVGIVVVVAVGSGKKADKPSPPPPPTPLAVQPQPPSPPVAPVAPPPPEPIKAEPVKPKAEPVVARKDDRKREEAAREAERKREEATREAARKREEAAQKRDEAAREAARKREEAAREAAQKREEAKREEERKRLAKAEAQKPKPEPEKPVQLPDAASALSPEAVQKVVSASRKAFETCIAEAAQKGTDAKFDGRRVALRLNVNPNGFVTYPTLDDVTLNRTDLGECLKAAARLMVFPKFQGDVFHVEVPLTLRASR